MDEARLRQVLDLAGAERVKSAGPRHLGMRCLFHHNHRRGGGWGSAVVSINDHAASWYYCHGARCHVSLPLTAALHQLHVDTGNAAYGLLATSLESGHLQDGPVVLPTIQRFMAEGVGGLAHNEFIIPDTLNYTARLQTVLKNPWPPEMLALLSEKHCTAMTACRYFLAFDPEPRFRRADTGEENTGPPSVVFPLLTPKGGKLRCIGGQWRPVSPHPFFKYMPWHSGSRYGRFFGEPQANARSGASLALVEGPFDTMRVDAAGYRAVGAWGVRFSLGQAHRIRRDLRATRLFLLLDADTNDQTDLRNRLHGYCKAAGVEMVSIELAADPKHLSDQDLVQILGKPT